MRARDRGGELFTPEVTTLTGSLALCLIENGEAGEKWAKSTNSTGMVLFSLPVESWRSNLQL